MHTLKNLFFILMLAMVIAGSAAPFYGFAAERKQFYEIVPLQGIDYRDAQLSFSAYVNRIFTISISIGGILAVIMLAYGGIEYMTGVKASDKKSGLDRIRGALVGLLLLLSVVIMLRIINPCILQITVFERNPTDCSPRAAEEAAPDAEGASPEGAYIRPDGSCVTGAATTCTSGEEPVAMCQNNANNNEFVIKPSGGCSTGFSGVYICERSSCGTPPSPVPEGARTYVGNEAACIRGDAQCSGWTADQWGSSPACVNLTEVCVFADGNRYAPKPARSSCPTPSEGGFMCLDGVTTTPQN